MPKKIRIFNTFYPIIPFFATLLAVIILIMLGNWQVRRLSEKRAMIETIEQSMKLPAQMIDLQDISNSNLKLFHKIKLKGHFAKNKLIFLYGKRSVTAEKDGYYVLSPFIMQQDSKEEVLLISRGWAPQSVKADLEAGKLSMLDEEQVIEAVVMPAEKKQFFVPENDIKKNIWFTIDPDFAAKTYGVTVENVYFKQINADNFPKGVVPLNADSLNKIRNDHLEYAISWYGLAIALIIMFIYYYHTNVRG